MIRINSRLVRQIVAICAVSFALSSPSFADGSAPSTEQGFSLLNALGLTGSASAASCDGYNCNGGRFVAY